MLGALPPGKPYHSEKSLWAEWLPDKWGRDFLLCTMDEILSGGFELDVPWVPEIMNYKKYTKCFWACLFLCFLNLLVTSFGLTCFDIHFLYMFFEEHQYNVEFVMTCANSHWDSMNSSFVMDEKMFPYKFMTESSQHLHTVTQFIPGSLFHSIEYVDGCVDEHNIQFIFMCKTNKNNRLTSRSLKQLGINNIRCTFYSFIFVS